VGWIWLAFWLGGKLSESEIAELKGKVDVLGQRVSFGKERADAATKEAADAKADFEKLRGQIANQAPRETLQDSADLFEGNLNRLLTANNSTATVLGFVSTGFNKRGGLNWRPIGEDEKHLLEPISIPETQTKKLKKSDE
jgi:hypothetical protein